MKKRFLNSRSLLIPAAILGVVTCLGISAYRFPDAPAINQVQHVVVIYMENHSFDNLYGQFKGADGLNDAKPENIIQVDTEGKPYTTLPPIPRSSAFPTNLSNNYFNIDQYVAADQVSPDVTHAFYQEQLQINGGKMNKFALYNFTKGLTMGYYNTAELPLYELAKKYTLCDHFFHSAFGGSFLNHQWLIAAASPVFPDAPSTIKAQVDVSGKLIKDGAVTPDGYAVNTSNSVNLHPKGSIWANLVPNQNAPNIGDRLSDKGISWAWYSGGWNDAIAGKPDPTFTYHHQPFAYFKRYAEGTAERKKHLRDETEFLAAAKKGTLPSVSFVKPIGLENEHPGESTVKGGESHAVELINAVLNGPNGKNTVIILTYDENGGFWDHVAPPVIDKWGPGSRIPALIISPFAKKGYVDHTNYETVSILAFIEKRWGLKPLTSRDQHADPLSHAFNF
ncbi:alkaline phosphatase family protein [Mucilaginibacter aquaedulcis]|uniref:alkaline phosphatase family protein n=1 Tax=Mucilaginibacter aquaedulcis TaxID=1187081 RepID=UPI0025B34156|nr:alkaline phosphatase family protein [Mucilaginibacter aquaedulcis]MDN3548666.1 alkaline phosphatase family protein [Mucilaginibacter aquaedulcis]